MLELGVSLRDCEKGGKQNFYYEFFFYNKAWIFYGVIKFLGYYVQPIFCNGKLISIIWLIHWINVNEVCQMRLESITAQKRFKCLLFIGEKSFSGGRGKIRVNFRVDKGTCWVFFTDRWKKLSVICEFCVFKVKTLSPRFI